MIGGAVSTSPGVVTAAVSFLSPGLAVAGAACVAVPVIIHLLTRQRRRPIEWAAMKFLLEAYRRHRRRLTLEQVLLLACRCLLVLLVGVALARPVLDDPAAARGPVHLYLLVDNSLTSQVREDSTAGKAPRTALDRSKEQGAALLADLDSTRGDRAAVLALSTPASPVVLPLSADLAAVARVLAGLAPEAGRADLAGAVAKLRADLADTAKAADAGATQPARVVIAVLSELRAGSLDLGRPLAALGTGPGAPMVRVPPPATLDADNIAITAVEPLRPMIVGESDQVGAANPTGNQVKVSLARFGPVVSRASSTIVKVRLTDGKSAPAGAADEALVAWQPGQETASVIVQVRGTSASTDALALVAMIDGDRLATDDTYVRPVEGRRAVRVAVIESLRLGVPSATTIDRFTPGDWVRLLLQPDSSGGPLRPQVVGLVPTTLDPASVGRGGLAGFDAAVVLAPDELTAEGWKRLGEFSRAGGMLLITPPADATVHLWGEVMARELAVEWTVGREAEKFQPPMGVTPEAPGGVGNPLIGMLAAEMPALARPVSLSRRLLLSAPEGTMAPVVTLADGSPLVACSVATPDRGLVVFLTAAVQLDWTDLPTKPLMLPLLHEVIRVGVGRSQPSFDQVAGRFIRLPPGTAELFAADERASSSPGLAAAVQSPGRYAGLWRALNRQGATISLVAVNPDPAASNTTVVPAAQSAAFLGGIAGAERVAVINASDDRSADAAPKLGLPDPRDREPMSVPLLAAALGLALAELALARAFSHAARTTPQGGRAGA